MISNKTNLSRMLLSYSVMIILSVTNQPVLFYMRIQQRFLMSVLSEATVIRLWLVSVPLSSLTLIRCIPVRFLDGLITCCRTILSWALHEIELHSISKIYLHHNNNKHHTHKKQYTCKRLPSHIFTKRISMYLAKWKEPYCPSYPEI